MVDQYDYANYYGADPWSGIELNERPWYDPILRDIYHREALYSKLAVYRVDMNGGARARTIYFNHRIPPRPNIAPIDARAMQATRVYGDSAQKDITVERYGNGTALHREDEMFNYWQTMGGGDGFGLLPLIQSELGQMVVDHNDILARNAFFDHPFPNFGLAGASSFAGIDNSDMLTTDLLDDVWLGMEDRSRPFQAISQPMPMGNELVCYTTPGAIYDLKREAGTGTNPSLKFVDAHIYADTVPLVKGEVGMWRGVRFVKSQMAKLHNVGTVAVQTNIVAPVKPGEGAPDPKTTKVESVRRVGQPNSKHYIEVTDATGFAAGDLVTVHEYRHDSTTLAARRYQGVLNGVDYVDPMAQVMEIHSVDTVSTPNRISFKEPYVMVKLNGIGLETSSGGTYGYVTKAKHIHSALFIPSGGEYGVACAVAQPPVFYTPIANDDYISMYRISYDMWLNYEPWEPRAYEVHFITGANKGFGAKYR